MTELNEINFHEEIVEPALPPEPKPETSAYDKSVAEWKKRYDEMSDTDKAMYDGYCSWGGD